MKTARDELIPTATTLRKAWLLSCAWVSQIPSGHEVLVPNYREWTTPRLREEVRTLRDDCIRVLAHIVSDPTYALKRGILSWMSKVFDTWADAGFDVKTIATAHWFEGHFGVLVAHARIEVPPYTELLLQSWHGVAYRHPEYMLARDLEFLVYLLHRSEDHLKPLDGQPPPGWARGGGENGIALGRAVTQACFNLLESFTSGLAHAHAMTNGTLSAEGRKVLLDNHIPLKERILKVPTLVSGKPILDDQVQVCHSLVFGRAKQQRDSFVHCEPGQQISKKGYVKESVFNDVAYSDVLKTVAATEQLIRQLWHHVYGRSGPRWMPDVANRDKLDTSFDLVPRKEVAPRFTRIYI